MTMAQFEALTPRRKKPKPAAPAAPPNFSNVWFGERAPFYGPGHPAIKCDAMIDRYDAKIYALDAQVREQGFVGNEDFAPADVVQLAYYEGQYFDNDEDLAAATGEPEVGEFFHYVDAENHGVYWSGFPSDLNNIGIAVPNVWTMEKLLEAPATGFEVMAFPFSERANSAGDFIDGFRCSVGWFLKFNGSWINFGLLNNKNVSPQSEAGTSLGVVTPEMANATYAYLADLVGESAIENFGLGFVAYTANQQVLPANDLGFTLFGVTPGDYDVLKYPRYIDPNQA